MTPPDGPAQGAAAADAAIADLLVTAGPGVARIEELVGYWDRKRGGRFACSRADIDPTELASHLPDLFMADVLDGGADFRYRLVGTQIVRGLGRDSTGRRLSELYGAKPAALQKVLATFRTVVEEKRPVFGRGTIFWLPSRDIRRFAAGYLPLSDDGRTVNIILAELHIFWS
jgi:hypothetical protein